MRVRIFERGYQDHGGLHDFDTTHVPSVGDLLSIEGDNQPASIYEVTQRMFRIDRTVINKEAAFYIGLEVKAVEGSSTLTRLFR